MRLKINISETSKHDDICSSVAWSSSNELTSIGDDNIMYKWNINTNQATKFMDLENFAVDLDWIPMTKGASQLFAIGFVDGSFKIIARNGKIEKTVTDAHKGSITCLKWSYDGGALATAGQDGSLKIWSKNGNIRSNLIQGDKSIYCVTWSPQSDSILYCCDRTISIKSMSSNKQLQWKAHDGVVLKADWNPSNNLIISGGQDCRYKVWDNYGRLLYSSAPYDYVITSLSWSPNGQYFAVGAFGMFKLCDKTGWTYSFHKTNIGSILKTTWSADGTLCCGSSGSGAVIFGQVVDRQLNYKNWQVNLNDENKIQVTDLINQIHEQLQFKQRVINMSMSYNDLIVTTAGQCYIYSFTNWNTPYIFDLKDSVSIIIQCPKYFCLVQSTNGLMIYNYEGKLVSNPKIAGAKFQYLNRKRISISQDILAVIDSSNSKLIKFFDITNGKPLNFTLDHGLQILQINLNQTQLTTERKIAFMDANRDLYLSPVHKKDIAKLCTICDSFIWHDRFDILCSTTDGKLNTYYYPNVVYIDKDLTQLCVQSKEATQIGRMSQMLNFTSSQVTVRRKDGGLVTLGISPYPSILFDFCQKSKWQKAIKLCRFVKEQILWSCLAAISLKAKQLSTAQIAFAAIEQADKIQYITFIKQLPSEISKNAALAMFFHKNQEAEQIYIQNKLYYRAIKMNIKLYHWDRALQLAQNYKVHLDTVVAYRKRYLERIGKQQTNKKFLKVNAQVGEIDWVKIKEVIHADKAKQKAMK